MTFRLFFGISAYAMNNYFRLGVGALALLMTAALHPPAAAQEKPKAAQQEHCLKYEPDMVTLTGVLKEEEVPDRWHDDVGTTTIWIILLDAPICVDENPEDPDFYNSEHNIGKVQPIIHDPNAYKRTELLNKRVTAKGSLFPSHTVHHFTRILIEIQTSDDLQPAG